MQSSYKIIKNSHVNLKDTQSKVIDTTINIKDKFYKDNQEIQEDKINEEISKEEIERQIRLEIEEEKKEILKKVEEDALEEVEKIKNTAYEKAYEEGYQKGYEDGTTQGLNQGMNEALNIKKRALELIFQSETYVEEYFKENKENLIHLAATMAESIVHHTIDISDENIMMILEPILREYAHKENIIITCHPENADILKGRLKELEELSGDNKIIILKDGNLEKNGCIIENSKQVMNLGVKTQIENILKDIKSME